ncbi:MAG: class I SAM-dependent DNA methyltransferase [Deltaproteobacteria bacterium]|nr:class I SAM-dependent DNA methyltransferase [Deltaproteobacteria bacterium]
MRLSWNEIRDRAVRFTARWAEVRSERTEAQTFWNEFFEVFGVSRRRVALFEEPIRRRDAGAGSGFADLLWKGVLVVEHKSRGSDLDRAAEQAFDYCRDLDEEDLPRFVLVSDFERLRLRELETGDVHEIRLRDFPREVRRFAFMVGQSVPAQQPESPVNLKAAQLMGRLHDALAANGYTGHPLERLLVRLMFCFFADHTGIFQPRGHFRAFVQTATRPDGSDLGSRLAQVFDVLDTPEDRRQRNLDEDLAALPYVDGLLFAEQIKQAAFDRRTRELLLDCCGFDWSVVSPAVFGAMFQAVMDREKRRNLGAHYTSEANILKTIGPLILDELRADFRAKRSNLRGLERLLGRIARLRIVDPACGCGNFLVVAYRELRRLELDIRKEIARLRRGGLQRWLDIDWDKGIDVDAMCGIEIEEFPARIAETALWLVDHQMNLEVSATIGEYYARLPLRKAPSIHNRNALELDWSSIAGERPFDFILGNPPFVGKKRRSPAQARDMETVCVSIGLSGELDYVCCWYVKAADYLARNPATRCAFVSTNSITQGEQVGILWPALRARGVRIPFAHRTFRWDNQAPGTAHVHVVIIGLAGHPPAACRLFDYENPTGEPTEVKARRINPYLVDAEDVFVAARREPLCADAPRAVFGSMPNDGGHLLLSGEERTELLRAEPAAMPLLRRFVGAREAIGGNDRWCLWLADVEPAELRSLSLVRQRIARVRDYRLHSERPATSRLAEVPHLFGENRQPTRSYIAIPRHSSELRRYLPLQYLPPDVIAGDACCVVESDELFHFGVLSSAMHMAWVRHVAGRIKSDLRYSNEIVYNNFPWPRRVVSGHLMAVRRAAKAVLATRQREGHPSLAALYDPFAMPRELVTAHRTLDRAVDRYYARRGFRSDLDRVRFLFGEYAALATSPSNSR